MATATKRPDTLVAGLRQQQKSIDEMRASARMRARLMRKIPKPVEFPRASVDVTNAGPLGQIGPCATAAAMGMRTDTNAREEPLSPPAGAVV